jgi:hypothetical protein
VEGGEVFVGCFSGTAPVAVVVDDEDASGHQARVELLELVTGGGVPVGVEPEQGDSGGADSGRVVARQEGSPVWHVWRCAQLIESRHTRMR